MISNEILSLQLAVAMSGPWESKSLQPTNQPTHLSTNVMNECK